MPSFTSWIILGIFLYGLFSISHIFAGLFMKGYKALKVRFRKGRAE